MNLDTTQNFEQFGFSSPILRGIKDAGFRLASPIQASSIPKILAGKDLVAQAHTGTGKTAAFGLPILDMMEMNSGIETLVISPTRELANQISDELYKLGFHKKVKTATIYGGQSYTKQINRIKGGANIVVATPGRLLDMLKSNRIEDFNPKYVILDEADEMLDMGFLDAIKEIMSYLPSNRQTLLFSATMPKPIKDLAKIILNDPEFISITTKDSTNINIEQKYYIIEEYERDDALTRLFDYFEPKKLIVFCRMKKEVDRVSTMLIARGYPAKGLHGDMEQRQRDEVIRSFKKGSIDILVATDVAARGLDISNVTHVFNYHIPFDPESYIHRIGRTGRADKKGIAITFATPLEFRELTKIQKKVGTKIEHCFIPTATEIKDLHLERYINRIKKQKINPEVTTILEELEEEMDISQICYKLLSMLNEKIVIQGNENIGINKDKIERILAKKRAENSNKRNRNKRGGYSRNRNNRSRNYNRR